MKVRVTQPFADKLTHKMYGVGQVIDLPDDRASVAVSKGLVAETAVKIPRNIETANKAPKKKAEKKPEKKTVNKRGKENARKG